MIQFNLHKTNFKDPLKMSIAKYYETIFTEYKSLQKRKGMGKTINPFFTQKRKAKELKWIKTLRKACPYERNQKIKDENDDRF